MCVIRQSEQDLLSFRVPAKGAANNKENESQQNAKLSKTVYYENYISSLIDSKYSGLRHLLASFQVFSNVFFYGLNPFRLANSLVNPTIYSYRTTMFREMFKVPLK